MARDFAKLLTCIWTDPDWRKLTSTDHDVYCALLTSDDLSWCGVLPYLPQRIAGFSGDLTVKKVEATLRRLEDANFVILDQGSGEIAIRSFVRNDKVMTQPNIVRAMQKSLVKVHSQRIVDNLHDELRRVHREGLGHPKGWDALRAVDPELFEEVTAEP